MKTFVLSAMICAAVAGNSVASPRPVGARKEYRKEQRDKQHLEVFKNQLAFHQRNIEVLWDQYERGVARIKKSKGNHTELDREEARLTQGYKKDIEQGIRVAESQAAMKKIATKYVRKHAQRDALENREIARLKELLKTELQNEKRQFESLKKKYAHVVDDQTLPLVQEVEHLFTQLIERAEALQDNSTA